MKTGVDTALAVEGKKTTTDLLHPLVGKDCKATRVIEEETLTVYCVETKPDFLTKKQKENKCPKLDKNDPFDYIPNPIQDYSKRT